MKTREREVLTVKEGYLAILFRQVGHTIFILKTWSNPSTQIKLAVNSTLKGFQDNQSKKKKQDNLA